MPPSCLLFREPKYGTDPAYGQKPIIQQKRMAASGNHPLVIRFTELFLIGNSFVDGNVTNQTNNHEQKRTAQNGVIVYISCK